jgi:hypothetical protein
MCDQYSSNVLGTETRPALSNFPPPFYPAVGILFVVGMTFRAMSFLRVCPASSIDVDLWRNWFKMGRLDATAIAA